MRFMTMLGMISHHAPPMIPMPSTRRITIGRPDGSECPSGSDPGNPHRYAGEGDSDRSITDEEVGNNYQTRNWGNVANLSNAIIALAATMGTQKEQQVANRLKSGATDLTVRQRAKRWLNDHYFNTMSRETTAYTTQPLFTDKGYKLLNSDSIMSKIKDSSGYYLRVKADETPLSRRWMAGSFRWSFRSHPIQGFGGRGHQSVHADDRSR